MIPPTTGQQRLDAMLVERGVVPTRARAQAAILAGEVYVNGVRIDKPGTRVPVDADLQIRPRRPGFVSRGGNKLDHALQMFGIDVSGLVAVDVGASTGGFTDCLLQRGARRVYAVDVGTGQLDWRLRGEPRVVSLEQRDIRTVTAQDLSGQVDLATVDVAFISLGTVLPAVSRLVRPGGTVVALVKPQFEVGPRLAGRGVVKDPAIHREVLGRTITLAEATGLRVLGATASPIAGPQGNIEFFLHLSHAHGPSHAVDVNAVVAHAHATIKRKRHRVVAVAARAR